jgi:hypothetical protein
MRATWSLIVFLTHFFAAIASRTVRSMAGVKSAAGPSPKSSTSGSIPARLQ